MKKELSLQILNLSRECLERYWQIDYNYFLTYLAENATWIGAQQEQFYQGKEQIARVLHRIAAEMQPCHLLHQEYWVVHSDKSSCTIMGRYLATTDETAAYFLQAWQRVTMLWIWTEEGPRIQHCHVSNPIGELKVAKGEAFVNTIGRISAEFLKLREQATHCRQRIVVTDDSEKVHFISPYEIEYASANRRGTIIVLATGQVISARIKIADLLEQSGGVLVSIHRSHLVNPLCISHLDRQSAVLQSGVTLPVPEKRATEIREQLSQFFSDLPEKKTFPT